MPDKDNVRLAYFMGWIKLLVVAGCSLVKTGWQKAKHHLLQHLRVD